MVAALCFCYDISDYPSFRSVRRRWLPEVLHDRGSCDALLLLGLKGHLAKTSRGEPALDGAALVAEHGTWRDVV